MQYTFTHWHDNEVLNISFTHYETFIDDVVVNGEVNDDEFILELCREYLNG